MDFAGEKTETDAFPNVSQAEETAQGQWLAKEEKLFSELRAAGRTSFSFSYST